MEGFELTKDFYRLYVPLIAPIFLLSDQKKGQKIITIQRNIIQ